MAADLNNIELPRIKESIPAGIEQIPKPTEAFVVPKLEGPKKVDSRISNIGEINGPVIKEAAIVTNNETKNNPGGEQILEGLYGNTNPNFDALTKSVIDTLSANKK